MNDLDDKEFVERLKPAFGPTDVELQHDLWPRMLKRFDAQAARVPWFDWALAASLAATLFFFPGVIPALLYHL
jgi:hypothetical protein